MQGFNMGRYVPPDAEGVASGNALHRKHPLGARAARLRSEGALVVRFEMPFAVWCAHCPRPTLIGQGVRFNAEKRRVGSYHSTPVWSFRLRHADCGGALEIRTDPANTAYVVASGGRRRDTGDGGEAGQGRGPGQGPIVTPRERQAERETAFSKLERTIEDRAAFEAARDRIDELAGASARHWEDPYARNQALRRAFRAGRRERAADAARGEELQDRMGLGIELLPSSEDDARRAALVVFGGAGEGRGPAEKALAEPLFGGPPSGGAGSGPAGGRGAKRLKPEVAAERRRESLAAEIVGNTRIVTDPFLGPRPRGSPSRTPSRLPGMKRRRGPGATPAEPSGEHPETREGPRLAVAAGQGLVDYDSD